MRDPLYPHGKLESACLRRSNFTHDRGISAPRNNWHAREAAARARSLAAHDQRLGSISKCL